MQVSLDLSNRSNTSFGMALLKPKDAKAFGKYFSMDKLRFRRGVKQVYKEQQGFSHTNLRFNDADRSISVLVNGEEVKNFPRTDKSATSSVIDNTKTTFEAIKAIGKSMFDVVFRPKRLVKANLYEAGEFAKLLEKEHAADVAKQAKKAAIAAKREAAQLTAVEKMFSTKSNN